MASIQNIQPFQIIENKRYDLSHGFLPIADPISQLSPEYSAWEATAKKLPELLMSNNTRDTIRSLPTFNTTYLKTPADYEKAMVMLSFLAHAYIWSGEKPADTLPQVIAKPWVEVAKQIDRPPILSYASYALYNWYRLDTKKPIELGNIALLQNFLGGEDEAWFILIHVDIEAKAIPALKALLRAIEAVNNECCEALSQQLQNIIGALTSMCETLDRMPEHCNPTIYYNRVRPYIHGWKGNPALPNGLMYEGVNEKPLFFKGETGAQSSIIPCLDALLGIRHAENPLKKHLNEMKEYMPTQHREFLHHIEKEARMRDFILQNRDHLSLIKLYNECIELIYRFRKTHIGYATEYIQEQAQTSIANPTEIGTGGTPFMRYLLKHLEETKEYVIK